MDSVNYFRYLNRKIMSVSLLPAESTVAVMQTPVVSHRLLFGLASGVNCLGRVDRLLMCSGDDRVHHTWRSCDVKGAVVLVRLLAVGFGTVNQKRQHFSGKCIDQLVEITEC